MTLTPKADLQPGEYMLFVFNADSTSNWLWWIRLQREIERPMTMAKPSRSHSSRRAVRKLNSALHGYCRPRASPGLHFSHPGHTTSNDLVLASKCLVMAPPER